MEANVSSEMIVRRVEVTEGSLKGQWVDVYFFEPEECEDYAILKQFEQRGLIPHDYAVYAVNKTNPDFRKEHPNGTLAMAECGWCRIIYHANGWITGGVALNVIKYGRPCVDKRLFDWGHPQVIFGI